MSKKKVDSKNKFLIQKIKKISEILDTESISEELIYEAVVDTVLIFENIVKVNLYKKNKLLIYNFNLDIDKVTAILTQKEKTIFTIEMREALSRYKKIFPKSKINKQGESIEILLNNRNQLQHGIDTKNMQNRDELVGILTSIFPTLIYEAQKILGVLPATKIKKEKSYSEKDIQNIYENIVLSKIKNYRNSPVFSISSSIEDFTPASANLLAEICPRCSNRSLSKDYNVFLFGRANNPDIYKCSNCKLELTNLEYDAVQKLKKEGKISNLPLWTNY